MLAFLSMLVEKRWFRQIYLIYLPVGHTHEKVDRDLFAPLGNLKTREPCETPIKFPDYVKKAFNKTRRKPITKNKLFYFDWKEFLEPEIRNIIHINQSRAFKIELDQLGQPVIFTKPSMLAFEWIGFEGSLIQGFFF